MLGTGLGLVMVNVDRLLAGLDGRYWGPFNYWIPGDVLGNVSRADLPLYVSLAAFAVPFVWAGVQLTLRRLRDAGLPVWLVALFFVPFVNLLLFLALCIAPTDAGADRAEPVSGRLARLMPHGEWGSAAAGLGLAAGLSVLLALLGTVVLGTYGWGLFVGVPFLSGLLSALVYGYREPRSAGRSVSVAITSVGLASMLLIGFAIEGAICIAMAAPLAGVVAVLGGLVGYGLQRHGPRSRAAGGLCSVTILLLPLLLGVERAAAPEPAVTPVRTSVVVAAPPRSSGVTWSRSPSYRRRQSSSSALESPTRQARGSKAKESARSAAAGSPRGTSSSRSRVGTSRACSPSPSRRNRAPMRELSPWGGIHPPHLDGFLRSRRGEFRLRALPGGRTLLVGTTWYENRMWPAAYWRLWSDELIHQIHRRVLEHVARESQREAQGDVHPPH